MTKFFSSKGKEPAKEKAPATGKENIYPQTNPAARATTSTADIDTRRAKGRHIYPVATQSDDDEDGMYESTQNHTSSYLGHIDLTSDDGGEYLLSIPAHTSALPVKTTALNDRHQSCSAGPVTVHVDDEDGEPRSKRKRDFESVEKQGSNIIDNDDRAAGIRLPTLPVVGVAFTDTTMDQHSAGTCAGGHTGQIWSITLCDRNRSALSRVSKPMHIHGPSVPSTIPISS
ncbi:hypothetical protein FIBSPDRAFT_904169 [Athelia psychrophila]|uniref:Uncharacterized protein n=1 Tax=Athelia psychrophila TaxID=1759441 RepID=A0A167V2B6_9AGAM|nr:hypothetical protein FIBSPDRAFT_904169 [Fibularhizoctonia sp. CBS 109695]